MIGARVRRSRLADGGQSTAELALLLPVLTILTLMVVQVGLVARDYVSVHHAAREAARHAARDPAPGSTESAAVAAASALDPARIRVQLSNAGADRLVTIEVGYRSPTAVPVVGAFVGDVPLSATAVVRLE